ncbi:MAG: hypothetical protein JWN69_427 [Alphaproteobacteria bacterium]|nr:hypothetical protein [Alphaproteobacteria bacterium]
MYHAPVSANSAPEGVPVEIREDETGHEVGNQELRDEHLRNAQAEARALFAPYLAIASVATTVLVAWSLFGRINLALLGGWLLVVGGANWLGWRRAINAAFQAHRTPVPFSRLRSIAEAILLAGAWASVPTYAFATQANDVQIVIGGAMAAMIIAGIALAAVPAAAIAWIVTITGALCAGYMAGMSALEPKLGFTIIAVASVAIAGVNGVSRWIYAQLRSMSSVRSHAESVRLLLKEYEHRGVGWLRQVDAENRVVYISSRMTSLLGRSASQ